MFQSGILLGIGHCEEDAAKEVHHVDRG